MLINNLFCKGNFDSYQNCQQRSTGKKYSYNYNFELYNWHEGVELKSVSNIYVNKM